MTNKKIMILLPISLILIIVGIVLGVVNPNNTDSPPIKPTNSPTPTATPDAPQDTESLESVSIKYDCHMQKKEYIEESNNIKYNCTNSYSFFVTNKNKIQSAGYNLLYQFATLEDMNTYYEYLLKNSAMTNGLIKDEATLTINYMNLMVVGGYTNFDNDYLDFLNNHGYICEKTDLLAE